MGYQVPKASHPWRRYANKVKKEEQKEEHKKSVHLVVLEIAQSWEKIEVVPMGGNKVSLSDLPQSKQALWLISFLKRNYVSY